MNPAQDHLIQVDPVLKDIINTIPTPEIERTNNVFHDLMSCVLEQQIHYRSTKKIFQKMLEKAGIDLLTPENFPEFENKAFDGIKLSMKKYETLLNLVQYWEKNDIDWTTLSDEEVKKTLTQIKGIGKWTMEMILIYTLNRPNIFALDDFHIKQIMTKLFELNPKSKLKAQMKAIAEPWQPYQSTAFLYLLAWKEFNKSKP